MSQLHEPTCQTREQILGGVISENLVVPSERSRPRRAAKRWIITAAVLALLACGLLLVGSRAAYDEWPWSSHPSTLHVCGRDYIDEGAQTRSQIVANGDHLVRVGSVPGWLNTGELWTTHVGAALNGTTCHVVMWVRTGTDTFEAYALSGGP